MTYYIGGEANANDLLGQGNPRYFYGLRRTEDGSLYFDKVDQLTSTEQIQINVPGAGADNYENFEWGVDFFDGRLASDHSRPYPNLFFDQYRWDQRNMYYYIDASGQLVVKIGSPHSYT